MTLPDPILPNMAHSCLLWLNLVKPDPTFPNLTQPDPTWSIHMNRAGLKNLLGQFRRYPTSCLEQNLDWTKNTIFDNGPGQIDLTIFGPWIQESNPTSWFFWVCVFFILLIFSISNSVEILEHKLGGRYRIHAWRNHRTYIRTFFMENWIPYREYTKNEFDFKGYLRSFEVKRCNFSKSWIAVSQVTKGQTAKLKWLNSLST